MNSIEQHKEKLMQDLNQVIKDTEDMLKNADNQGGDSFRSAKARFEHTLNNAKAEVQRIEQAVVAKAKETAQATDTYVKENPWQSAGIAAGVGLLIGLLIGRSK